MFNRYFVDHPKSVGESYFEHMGVSSSFSWALAKASGATFVHALVPGLCVKTGSNIIRELHGRMVANRVTHASAAAASVAGAATAGLSPEEDAMIWLAANI